jgi:hypothetical protein
LLLKVFVNRFAYLALLQNFGRVLSWAVLQMCQCRLGIFSYPFWAGKLLQFDQGSTTNDNHRGKDGIQWDATASATIQHPAYGCNEFYGFGCKLLREHIDSAGSTLAESSTR